MLRNPEYAIEIRKSIEYAANAVILLPVDAQKVWAMSDQELDQLAQDVWQLLQDNADEFPYGERLTILEATVLKLNE